MSGQSAQYKFFTANVIVFSAANAADAPRTPKVMAAETRSLLMRILRLRGDEQRRKEIKSKRGSDKNHSEHEPCLDKPVRQRARAA
jgi:hypothetical protein